MDYFYGGDKAESFVSGRPVKPPGENARVTASGLDLSFRAQRGISLCAVQGGAEVEMSNGGGRNERQSEIPRCARNDTAVRRPQLAEDRFTT